jgi:hypothetical protein
VVFLDLGTNTQKLHNNNHTKKKDKKKMKLKQTTMVKSVHGTCPQRIEFGTCP